METFSPSWLRHRAHARRDAATAVIDSAYGPFPLIEVGDPITVGGNPQSVAFSPDGKTAYVANSDDNTVTPIDVATGTPGDTIDVGSSPYSIAVSPDGTLAYVANYGDNTVTPIDLTTGTPGDTIDVGGNPFCVAFSPDGSLAYVANSDDDTVTPIDVATGTPGDPISVGSGPRAVAFSWDGTVAYVANYSAGTVTVIDVGSGAPSAHYVDDVLTPDDPITVGGNPAAVAFSLDCETAYVANSDDGTVTPIDVATATAGDPITVGTNPSGIAFSPDATTAYVTNQTDGTVTPIDIATGTPIGQGTRVSPEIPLPVGTQPSSVAFSPDGMVAYVTNYNDGTVTPIQKTFQTVGELFQRLFYLQ